MDEKLAHDFIQSLYRFRQIHSARPNINKFNTFNMHDFAMLTRIVKAENAKAPDLGHEMFMSKAAVSQKLGSMEERGLITRGINKEDRRRRDVKVTAKGTQMIEQMQERMHDGVYGLLGDFGEDKTRELIKLLNELADCWEKRRAMRQEQTQDERKTGGSDKTGGTH
jgi:DNA-binding MarR family transcriptional regulator